MINKITHFVFERIFIVRLALYYHIQKIDVYWLEENLCSFWPHSWFKKLISSSESKVQATECCFRIYFSECTLFLPTSSMLNTIDAFKYCSMLWLRLVVGVAHNECIKTCRTEPKSTIKWLEIKLIYDNNRLLTWKSIK